MIGDTDSNHCQRDCGENRIEENGSHRPPKKSIVMCFDGTGDWATNDRTNVFEIFCRIDTEQPSDPDHRFQLAYYDGGVGTLADPAALSGLKKTWLRLLDLATAMSLRSKVLTGYEFLIENYNEGDHIYLFGFSRGAFVARVLAAMILRFGLLKRQHKHLSGYLWQSISELKRISTPTVDGDLIKAEFARADVKPVEIQFLGLFDTVSSVGILERFKIFPNTDVNPAVLHARHAVSIHEQRNAFPEELLSPIDGDVVEVWFPGVHRDIGGGNSKRPGQAATTLTWIMHEAQKFGLRFETEVKLDGVDEKPVQVNPSTFDWYVFAGLYPMTMFDRFLDAFRLRWPNFNNVRMIPGNALVHKNLGNFPAHNVPATATFVELANMPQAPKRYSFRTPGWTVADVVGIALGVTGSVLLANSGFENVLGPSWPKPSTWAVPAMLLLYIVALGFSQQIRRGVQLAILVGFGLAVSSLFWVCFPWPAFAWGMAGGSLIAALSQIPFIGPAVRADRAIPYFVWPAITLGLTNLAMNRIAHVRLGKAVPAPFEWSFTMYRDFHVFGLFTVVLLALLVLFWVGGIFTIIKDRVRMKPKPAQHRPEADQTQEVGDIAGCGQETAVVEDREGADEALVQAGERS